VVEAWEVESIGGGAGRREAESRVVSGARQQVGEAPRSGGGRCRVSGSNSGRRRGRGRRRQEVESGGGDGDGQREGDNGAPVMAALR
jgi:hypothetical protein